MMIAGVDIGAETTKVAIVGDGKVLAQALVETGFDQKASAEQALNQALQTAKAKREDIGATLVTGAGRAALKDAKQVDPNIAAAKGAFFFFPTALTVIDVGAEEARAVKLREGGKVKDFVINEKCAAGAGIFIKAMARALELPVNEFATIALKSTQHTAVNAQCTIFAESEVVSLIHERVPLADISRAIHDAMAERIYGMVSRVGLEKDIVLIGGMARNVGFVTSLRNVFGKEILVPNNPEYVSAVGAALSAGE